MVLVALIVVAFAVGVVLFRYKELQLNFAAKATQGGTNVVSNKLSVGVIKPTELSQNQGTAYKATLQAKQEGIISSKNSGKVINIIFDDGKQVAQGEELVVLDDQDIQNQLKSAESQLEVSKASLQKTGANLENVQRTYNRTKELVEQGAAAQADLENAETSLKSTQADVAANQANIQTAQTNIDNLQTTLDNTIIRAPITGVIDGKNVSLGQFLNQGSVLGKVLDISAIDAVVEIDQALIQNIKIGQKAQVILNEDESQSYEGVVKSIDPSADSSSRAFKVKVELANKDQSLKPGVSAKVRFIDNTKAPSFVIPVSLINGQDGNYYVFINENGIARKRTVTIGNLFSNQAEIKTGLQGNEAIISTNLNVLQDGDSVTVASK
ncbi:RND family efflux transporter, MFP subunit [Desulfosporosinus acidiphilus SJ4]|uniref:RND family efflux transporter, MFP subunit n=1 Tax=Desulfosporosinus acidiphilus (strain DSM 22704 / JCM 16185 / SJ4) TaxID=646529 RepID=I4D258_DESAJ|nr:efflux RND transporter periplasmic adaptor subunit [Desulfosporosinus acidiphilus]AFM39882.1 RND family efflux transporter, MFP subunit [Desulfosporosinus acidiphilus SJ4]